MSSSRTRRRANEYYTCVQSLHYLFFWAGCVCYCGTNTAVCIYETTCALYSFTKFRRQHALLLSVDLSIISDQANKCYILRETYCSAAASNPSPRRSTKNSISAYLLLLQHYTIGAERLLIYFHLVAPSLSESSTGALFIAALINFFSISTSASEKKKK